LKFPDKKEKVPDIDKVHIIVLKKGVILIPLRNNVFSDDNNEKRNIKAPTPITA
jgi:hypothetical protein